MQQRKMNQKIRRKLLRKMKILILKFKILMILTLITQPLINRRKTLKKSLSRKNLSKKSQNVYPPISSTMKSLAVSLQTGAQISFQLTSYTAREASMNHMNAFKKLVKRIASQTNMETATVVQRGKNQTKQVEFAKWLVPTITTIMETCASQHHAPFTIVQLFLVESAPRKSVKKDSKQTNQASTVLSRNHMEMCLCILIRLVSAKESI